MGPRARLPVTLAAALLILTVVPASATPGERAPAETGSYIVTYRQGAGDVDRLTRLLERARGFKASHRFSLINGFAARLTPAQVNALRSDPNVELVSPDLPVHALDSQPLASGDSAPTGVRRIEAATTSYVRGRSNVNVAVIDTGIDLSHADLNAVHGKNCVGSGQANDDNGHGTHVAGTIAARNNGSGVVGVAPDTRLFAVKVLGADGGGTWSSVICGIEWVTSTRTDSDPGNDIAVANMSLGGLSTIPVGNCATTSDALHRAICASVAAGVNYVVAAGNSGWDFDHALYPDVPAAYPQVLTVTAIADSDGQPGAQGGATSCGTTNQDDRFASFSNFALTAAGAAHAVAAPGTCITSTWRNGGYATISGTSMATPHVAGAVALCLDHAGTSGPCAGLTPAQVIAKLRADAQARTSASSAYGFAGDPVRPISNRYYGYLAHVGVEPPAGPPSATEPLVSGYAPADGATGVAAGAKVSVTFSEPMDKPATQAAFSLVRNSNGAKVAGSFSWSGKTMTFTPGAALLEAERYTASIASSALTTSGTAVAGVTQWSFRVTTTGTRAPYQAVIKKRALRSGSYASLAANDNVFFEVFSTRKSRFTSAWIGRFSNVPKDLTALRISYSGRNSRACNQVIHIWRWTTSRWVLLDKRSVGTNKVTIERSAAKVLANYVSGSGASGDVRVRVRCRTTGGQFHASADFLQLTYTRP